MTWSIRGFIQYTCGLVLVVGGDTDHREGLRNDRSARVWQPTHPGCGMIDGSFGRCILSGRLGIGRGSLPGILVFVFGGFLRCGPDLQS